MVKNLPASAADTGVLGSISGKEDPLEEEMATHPGILAWRIPWTEEPVGLQSMGSQRVRYDLVNEQQQQQMGGDSMAQGLESHGRAVVERHDEVCG